MGAEEYELAKEMFVVILPFSRINNMQYTEYLEQNVIQFYIEYIRKNIQYNAMLVHA
jgi:hypothetical protein